MTGRIAPSAERNRTPILDILQPRLNQPGTVLEVASGSGEHAAWYAEAMPHLTWQPSDREPDALASIEAWRLAAALPNLLPPLLLDASAPWPDLRANAVVAINMIHIAPWAATKGLMAGAARVLEPAGLLFLYGPFRVGGVHTAPSNAAFDADLQARDPAWGVRDVEAVCELAAQNGLQLAEQLQMPANNLSLIFRRGPAP